MSRHYKYQFRAQKSHKLPKAVDIAMYWSIKNISITCLVANRLLSLLTTPVGANVYRGFNHQLQERRIL
jgi:hypothetical protein